MQLTPRLMMRFPLVQENDDDERVEKQRRRRQRRCPWACVGEEDLVRLRDEGAICNGGSCISDSITIVNESILN